MSSTSLAVGSPTNYTTIQHQLTFDLESVAEPLAVLGTTIHATRQPGTEALIRWKDLPAFEDSWEMFDTIQQQFPDFDLEKQDPSLGGRMAVPEYGFMHLELIPMLVGFFTYKIATFIQAIEEALTVVGKDTQVR